MKYFDQKFYKMIGGFILILAFSLAMITFLSYLEGGQSESEEQVSSVG